MDLKITRSEVRLREYSGTIQIVRQFIICWDKKTVFNHERAECFVTHIETLSTIF
ncbi:hypothetical protein Scep_019357 [Stephania cephalantha]|uniref:Uncharacterized protein n=1 Tax=Stephania cephalantha TaxID=152367 RepID=A0AAP0IAN5_9MAGN